MPLITRYREHAVGGALLSYGSIRADIVRGAATDVDRLLRGAKVSELPVQFPRPSTNWSSTSKLPRQLGSPSPRHSCCAQTK